MTSARALYDFGNRYNTTGMTWSAQINGTYPADDASQQLNFAEAMMAYVMSCNTPGSVTCNLTEAYEWLDLATKHFEWYSVRPHVVRKQVFCGQLDVLLPFSYVGKCKAVWHAVSCKARIARRLAAAAEHVLACLHFVQL